MGRLSWKTKIGIILVGLSLLLALLHMAVFRDPKTFFFYLVLDIAFVPIQVLLVTLIIERLLNEREQQALLHKLNMVIGAFFSEMGTSLLRRINGCCMQASDLARTLAISGSWSDQDFKAARRASESTSYQIAAGASQLQELREFLLHRRAFVLGLLQNPNLLEHETFTNLLWAVCHLTEELEARTEIPELPPADLEHLNLDISRAYRLLIREWLAYLQHLKTAYPYIYSLSIRTNPFASHSTPIIPQ